MLNDLLLGIDGGGSKTRALVADGTLRVLGAGEAGSSNLHVVGLEAAADAIASAAAAALAAAGPTAMPTAICLALAGVGRPAEQALVEAWAGRHWAGRLCTVVTDAEPVLAAGTPDGWGVALIAGTGSVCLGRAPDGRLARAGGWGYLLGDEGGGYDLAVRALRLAAWTADGRAAAHGLLEALLAQLGLATADGLVRRIYGGDTSPAALAALATPLVALAEQGDPDAVGLLAESATQLALMARTVARRLELRAAPLALAGGVLGASPLLRGLVADALGADWVPITFVQEPARGTLLLARRLLV